MSRVRITAGVFVTALIAFLITGLAAYSSSGEEAKPNDSSVTCVRWDADVKPALASQICFRYGVHEGKVYASPALGMTEFCIESREIRPDLQPVADVVGELSRKLMRRSYDFAPRDLASEPTDEEKRVLQQDFADRVLGDKYLREVLMPRVHEILEQAECPCSDCPGPAEPVPPRQLRLSQIMPYVTAYVWPYKIGAFRVCTGIEILDRVNDRFPNDQFLADIGLEQMFWKEDRAAMEIVMEIYQRGSLSPEYRAHETDEEKLAFLDNFMDRELVADGKFVRLIAERVQGFDTSLVCSDCKEAVATGRVP